MKEFFRAIFIRLTNVLGFGYKRLYHPKGYVNFSDWHSNNRNNSEFILIIHPKIVHHSLPFTIDNSLHKIFQNFIEHKQNEGFVGIIKFNGRIWGRNGTILTPDNQLISDVSREFGAYGGVFGENHSIFKQLWLQKPKIVKGNIAVIASSGSMNYHHWLFDILPRIELLRISGYLEKIDFFIINYENLQFQQETLKILGIHEKKIITSNNRNFHYLVQGNLFITSHPSILGTINPWVFNFVRNTFLLKIANQKPIRLYISRKKAPSRKIINETEFEKFLYEFGFTEIFAEDFSVQQMSEIVYNAEWIIGVHGSGFANLVFANENVKVIDIVAPHHIDAYYWILTDYCKGKYAYLFAEGFRIDENIDLVKNKIDTDLYIDIKKLHDVFKEIN